MRRTCIVLILALCSAPDFARCQEEPENDRPPEPALDEEAEREAKKLLERTEELLRRNRKLLDEIDRRFIAMLLSPGFRGPFAPPPLESPPKPSSVEFAWPRGVQWLAARQRIDGRWGHEVEATGLATMAILSDEDVIEPRSRYVARLRIVFLTHRLPDNAWRTEAERGAKPSLRELGISVYTQCALAQESSAKENVSELRHRVQLLLDQIGRTKARGADVPKSTRDPIAEAWAAAAILKLRDLEAGGVPFSDLGAPDVDVRVSPDADQGTVAESTLALLAAAVSGEATPESVVERHSANLIRSLKTRGKRSLDEWYLGAVALKSHYASGWRQWEKAMERAVLGSQSRDGGWVAEKGAGRQGRIRATALALLCLHTASTP